MNIPYTGEKAQAAQLQTEKQPETVSVSVSAPHSIDTSRRVKPKGSGYKNETTLTEKTSFIPGTGQFLDIPKPKAPRPSVEELDSLKSYDDAWNSGKAEIETYLKGFESDLRRRGMEDFEVGEQLRQAREWQEAALRNRLGPNNAEELLRAESELEEDLRTLESELKLQNVNPKQIKEQLDGARAWQIGLIRKKYGSDKQEDIRAREAEWGEYDKQVQERTAQLESIPLIQYYNAQRELAETERGEKDVLRLQEKISNFNTMQAAEKEYSDSVNRRRKIDARIAQLDFERDKQLRAAENAAIDPRRYFKDMPWYAKVVAVLTTALAGAQAGLNGRTENRGLDLLMQLNQEDVQAQQANYEKSRDLANIADKRYSDAIALWGDPESAKAQLAANNLALIQKRLEIQRNNAANKDTVDAIDAVIMQIEQEKMQYIEQLRAQSYDRVNTEISQETVQSGPAGTVGINGTASRAPVAGGKAPGGSKKKAPVKVMSEDEYQAALLSGDKSLDPNESYSDYVSRVNPEPSKAKSYSLFSMLSDHLGREPNDSEMSNYESRIIYDGRITDSNGYPVFLRGEGKTKDYEGMRTAVGSYFDVIRELGTLNNYIKSGDHASARGVVETLTSQLTQMSGAGVPTGQEAERFKAAMGNPSEFIKFFKTWDIKANNALRNNITSKFNTWLLSNTSGLNGEPTRINW